MSSVKVFATQDASQTYTIHYTDPYVTHMDKKWAQKFLISHTTVTWEKCKLLCNVFFFHEIT